MAISLYAASVILRDWCSERRSVRFSFIGRGISLSCAYGKILDVSEKAFTFSSKDVTTTVDVAVLPDADFVLLEKFRSVLPAQIVKKLDGEEQCALIFKGV